MPVIPMVIQLNTRGNADMVDITVQVAGCVNESGLKNGTVTLFCPSSTSGLTTIEYEPGCLSDLNRLFDQIVNPDDEYAHDAAWGDGNGHADVRSALLGASLCIPFVNARLTLGTWQQIVYADFDTRSRRRELVVQVIGEA